ncbi:hypothetical protein [Desulfosporosinus sp. Sb-LF]|uniref:hypothetical protein n=1 Tax=Desulfosporosinus sp. Sb-LF TaxID=2560027 RepID=UPI0013053859|nr:hypothetical protein [Desulfosporosinus sp. Sb-LF]
MFIQNELSSSSERGRQITLSEGFEKFKDVFDNSSDIVKIVAFDGRIQYINAELPTYLG